MFARITLVAVLLIIQFGLAILGWGGFEPFFSHPAFVVLLVLSILLSIVSLFSEGNLSSGEREDRSNRWVFIAFAIVALLSAYVPAYTDRGNIWTIDGETIRWFGIFLVLTGSVVRLWPVFVLGNRFSGLVAIQAEHRLVTTGIYGTIRNPSYLGLIITAFGWALVFRSGIGLILAAFNIPILIGRMNAEERLLRGQFGAEYDAYVARTWRLIPYVY
ncbi:MAG TPA: isoprenylcysteine carboxylmethyltransferase family protein [Methylovirgula sp.]|nr:isoprenylcysteine carboxylmethyltransferase family protein [Methylovirgula sp.]